MAILVRIIDDFANFSKKCRFEPTISLKVDYYIPEGLDKPKASSNAAFRSQLGRFFVLFFVLFLFFFSVEFLFVLESFLGGSWGGFWSSKSIKMRTCDFLIFIDFP